MSEKAEFFRAIEILAHARTPEARQAIDRYLSEARRILAIIQAERYIMEGWHHADQQLDGN